MDALGCVLIASFCWSAATAPVLGLWLSINAVAMVVRTAVAFAYRLGRLPAIGTRGWAAALIAGAEFDGLMWGAAIAWVLSTGSDRSAERRVGKECFSPGRYRGTGDH